MEDSQKEKYLSTYGDSVGFILNLDENSITYEDKLTVELNYNHLLYLESCGVFTSISFQDLQKLKSAKSKAKNILENL